MSVSKDTRKKLRDSCRVHLPCQEDISVCKECAVMALMDDLEHMEFLIQHANDYLSGFGNSVQRSAHLATEMRMVHEH